MKELLITLLEQCFDDARDGIHNHCSGPVYERFEEWTRDNESEINKICGHE